MNTRYLADPSPDFTAFERVIRGEEKPQRVHLAELLIDAEVLQALAERYLGMQWAPIERNDREREELFYSQRMQLFYRLGYDCVNLGPGWLNHPDALARHGADTALLGRGERRWIEEAHGLITNREDYQRFPWDDIQVNWRAFECAAKHLPKGMKITLMGTVFQHVVFTLFGTERTLYLLYDDPELVGMVFDRWGQKVYDMYAQLVDAPEVGAFWHGDDLGFNTSTLMSPRALRQYFLPWLKKYAQLAHDHGKTCWLHCCGNVYDTGIINDLIEDVHLDAFHSFQDPILPIGDFLRRYGDRLAGMGGVDMDKLCRLGEKDLRAYMRGILDECMPQGRFAFGSGNTVANYVPVEHYMWMIDEARRWKP